MACAAAVLGLALPAYAQNPQHAVVLVNDARSHGKLGDDWLSLNEGILLSAGKITEKQLSAKELAQVQGRADDVAWVDIDFQVVPKVTLERDLDPVPDTTHGTVVGGTNGTPEIALGAFKGFVSTSSFFDLRNLVVTGGDIAVRIQQPDTFYGTLCENVVFRGQSQGAIEVDWTTPNATGRIQLEACLIDNVPFGVVIDGRAAGRNNTLEIVKTRFVGGTTGVRWTAGSGARDALKLDRVELENVAAGITVLHPGGASQQLLADVRNLRARGGNVALEIPGSSTTPGILFLRMLDLAGQSAHGLRLGAAGTLRLTLEDGRLAGNQALTLGGAGLDAANLRVGAGTWTLAGTNASSAITSSIFRGTTLQAAGSGSALRLVDNRLVQASVTGAAGHPVRVESSTDESATLGSNVTVQTPRTTPHIGDFSVTPRDPQIGTPFKIAADLPTGLAGVPLLGPVAMTPLLGPRPFHFYLDTYFMVPLAAMRTTQSTSLTVPNNPILRGQDLILQFVVFADPGVKAPAIDMPPGAHVRIR